MAQASNELAEEFPGLERKIHDLKAVDYRFALLTEDYHDVNSAIRRADLEAEVTPSSRLESLRKTRRKILDQVSRALSA